MLKKVTEEMQDRLDQGMDTYVNSAYYLQRRDEIDAKAEELRVQLSPEGCKILDEIMDARFNLTIVSAEQAYACGIEDGRSEFVELVKYLLRE